MNNDLSTEAQINRYFTAKGCSKGLPFLRTAKGQSLVVAPLLYASFQIPENLWFSTYQDIFLLKGKTLAREQR
ncbi:MAG TPA: hypothetical protein ENG03_10745 [Thioploca sp.]|nr:hypothetical protein [Thioploca sp.]